MLTNNSEQIITTINLNMFYREFTFDKNDFRASDGNKVELADNVIWLDDLLILIQIKERNHADAKTDQVKWFQNKVLKKAKNQVKNSLKFLKEEQHIYISNPLGQTFDLKTADIRKVHNLIIYHLNEAPTSSVSAVKMYRCTDGTFIHVIESRDYGNLCRYLITPADMDDYLSFRERFLLCAAEMYIPEQYIFAHFFKNPEDLTICQAFLESLEEICSQIDEERSEISMFDFIDHINSTLKVANPEYRVIVRELAKLSRAGLSCFKERLLKLLNKEPVDFPVSLLRFVSVRTGCGFVLMKLRRDQEVHWMNALRNLTEQFKYKHRLERCLGVIIMHPDDDRMIDVNWAYIERPWLFDPILERQLEYELGL